MQLVLSKLRNAKPSGKGWSACCPAHDDRRASLSIGEGNDGRALLHCHAGCDTKTICESLNLRPGELSPEASTVYGISKKPEREHDTVDKPSSNRNGPTFATDRDAVAELERRHGPRSAIWTYTDAEGKPCGVIVRWDRPEGKDIRPIALVAGRWHLGGMPEPRPLYGLPEALKAETVYVTEGEKAADAARSLGLTATTSAHGSQSASKTDWRPLAGKQVVILPDNDEPGRGFADAVAAILGKLTPRPNVKIVELPGLPPKGDAVDWIAAQADRQPDELRAELERYAAEAEVIGPEHRAELLHFVPFVVDVLGAVIAPIVKRAAKALGCDPSFVAVPLLTAFGAAIGNTRQLRLKGTWFAPPIIWSAIVARSGEVKSPAIDIARKPVQAKEKRAFKKYKAEREVYENDLQEYERDRRDYQTGKRNEVPEKPTEPIADRYWVDDVTIEAIAARLQSQPRGLLLVRDELAGWFGGFDRYAGSKGGDGPRWLESFGARSMRVDRKSGEPINVDRAAVCITGSIQPAILKRVLSPQYRESGLAARMLFAFPPRRAKRWNDAAIEPRDEESIATILNRLYELEFGTDTEGEPEPITIEMTAEAKALYVEFFDEHNREAGNLTDDLGAAWSKLEEYAPRLALVVHYVRWATNDLNLADEFQLDADSMAAGIELARWFANEAKRIYAMLDESDDDAERRNLVAWIEHRGGRATPREVKQGNRRLASTEDAEKALIELVELGYGSWEPPNGGRGQPARRFVLSTLSPVYGNGAESEKNTNSVDVDTVDTAEESGDWGEI